MKKVLIYFLAVIFILTGCGKKIETSSPAIEPTTNSGLTNSEIEVMSSFLETIKVPSLSSSTTEKTYINNEDGYSITFPKDWYVYKTKNISEVTITPHDRDDLIKKDQVMLRIIRTKINANIPQSAEEEKELLRTIADRFIALAKKFNSDAGIIVTESEVLIDGVPAIRAWEENVKLTPIISQSNISLEYDSYVLGEGAQYWLIIDGKRFAVEYSYPKNERAAYSQIFEDIVKSIRFIK